MYVYRMCAIMRILRVALLRRLIDVYAELCEKGDIYDTLFYKRATN